MRIGDADISMLFPSRGRKTNAEISEIESDIDMEGGARRVGVPMPSAASGAFRDAEQLMLSRCTLLYPRGSRGGTSGREKYSVNASSGLEADVRKDGRRSRTTPRIRTQPSISSNGRGSPLSLVFAVGAEERAL